MTTQKTFFIFYFLFYFLFFILFFGFWFLFVILILVLMFPSTTLFLTKFIFLDKKHKRLSFLGDKHQKFKEKKL